MSVSENCELRKPVDATIQPWETPIAGVKYQTATLYAWKPQAMAANRHGRSLRGLPIQSVRTDWPDFEQLHNIRADLKATNGFCQIRPV
ncbi:unnamed protein product [Strongylus vulgaris]|uniref:Uncharacterized protein n=1 Tax=Strongylus vulgaris TaxID=40348 RepID=A0A3P7I8F9_STRVU|nr:unnamed protein product [Strongylus vulgaris]